MSFTIYRNPPGIKKLQIGEEALHFGGLGEESCNAILVDDYPTGDTFGIMARMVSQEGRDMGGPLGIRNLPASLYDSFISELNRAGFVPCYRHNGTKGEIIPKKE